MTQRFDHAFGRLLGGLGIAACCGLAAAGAVAQTPDNAILVLQQEDFAANFERLSDDQLKVLYLNCARESARRAFGSGDAAFCSVAYEALKRRVFGGEFHALYAWERAQLANDAAMVGAPE